MASFAKMGLNNKVIEVLVIHDNELVVDGVENEQHGINFLRKLTGWTNWKQTSSSAHIRKNHVGRGGTYDASRDAFIAEQPFDSWILNEDTCQWEAPASYPNDGKRYEWNEDTTSWKEIPAS